MALFEGHECNLYYEYHPGKNKETVFLLNGVMMSADSWKYQSDFFKSQGFGVLLHDFKGQLLSDKPEGPYEFSEHTRDCVALMDHLGLNQVHLIGTSYGGEVGLQFALDAPERIKSLTVIDSVAQVDKLLKQKVGRWEEMAKKCDPVEFFKGMLPDVYSKEYIDRNLDILHKRADIYAGFPPEFLKGQIALYQTFYKFDVADRLMEIQCPTLVICGEEDYLKTVAHSQVIARGIAHSEFVILPRAGHACFVERASAVNSLLLGFTLKHSS